MPQLRNGQETLDIRLDRIYELDWRSLKYTVGSRLTSTPTYRPRSYTWDVDAWLDQGQEGACVGFAFSHELAARPQVVEGVTDLYARGVYHDAQRIDPWEGGSYEGATEFYEGTSVLAGAQVLERRGFYDAYYWALSVQELARGLAYFGPCVLGVYWFEGMFDTDPDGYVHPIGRVMGGHAILANAIKIVYKAGWGGWWSRNWSDVDWDRSYVTLHNSWSWDWGQNGTAKLSLRDLDYLLRLDGEACFPDRSTKRSV